MPVAAIRRENERQRRGQMRRDVVDDLFLHTRFMHQPDAALREIPESAVQQPAGPAARAKGKIVLLHQPGAQPAQRGVARDARADDAAADDEHVQRRFG